MVLSRIRLRASARRCCRECRSCDAALCAAGGGDKLLVLTARARLVAPFRIRGGRVCAGDNGRSAITHSSATKIDREKSEQPHTAPALQQLLLLASDSARTRTGASNGGLAQVLHAAAWMFLVILSEAKHLWLFHGTLRK